MADFCLRPEVVENFKKALISKELKPEELSTMSSDQRRAIIGKYVGEENAKAVNTLFESKLILKNQQRGLMRWVEKVAANNPTLRKSLVERIESMDKILSPENERAFLSDLVEKKLGMRVTAKEAENIMQMSKTVEDLKAKIPENAPDGSKEVMEYGTALYQYKKYLEELIVDTEKVSFKEFINNPEEWARSIPKIAGAAKSAKATLDNSFYGRQALKILFTNPELWGKNFLKSWKDIAGTLKGIDELGAIKADVWSRQNARNGRYALAKVDLGLAKEEAYPSQVWEKIPGLGRLFKASETAYTGGALRMRADLADKLFAQAEEAGVNLKDKREMEAIGQLVNAMTGRGKLKTTQKAAENLNVLLFSPRFLRSNFDTLTAHMFQPDMKGTYAKKVAAKNLGKIIVSTGAFMGLAESLFPGSVEFDPRSSDFGKIKIGNTTFDITGGMGSLAVLASRLATLTTKTSSGVKKSLVSGEFGSTDGMDLIENFFEGKLAPGPAIVRDLLQGETFSGEDPRDPKVIAKQLFVPIPLTTWQQLRDDPDSANDVLAMMADALGFSTTTSAIGRNDWNKSTSKEMQQFKAKVGQDTFDAANKEYNVELKKRLDTLRANAEFQQLSEDDKADEISRKKADVKKEIFKKYKFTPKKSEPRKAIQLQ